MNNFIKAISLLRRYAVNLRTSGCPWTGNTQIVGNMVVANNYSLNRLHKQFAECGMQYTLIGATGKAGHSVITIIIQEKWK